MAGPKRTGLPLAQHARRSRSWILPTLIGVFLLGASTGVAGIGLILLARGGTL